MKDMSGKDKAMYEQMGRAVTMDESTKTCGLSTKNFPWGMSIKSWNRKIPDRDKS